LRISFFMSLLVLHLWVKDEGRVNSPASSPPRLLRRPSTEGLLAMTSRGIPGDCFGADALRNDEGVVDSCR
jgi:hypothetical protein